MVDKSQSLTQPTPHNIHHCQTYNSILLCRAQQVIDYNSTVGRDSSTERTELTHYSVNGTTTVHATPSYLCTCKDHAL